MGNEDFIEEILLPARSSHVGARLIFLPQGVGMIAVVCSQNDSAHAASDLLRFPQHGSGSLAIQEKPRRGMDLTTTRTSAMNTPAPPGHESEIDLPTLASRLAEDQVRLLQGLTIGDSAMLAPRIGRSDDKRSGVARRLARELFPASEEERTSSYISYAKMVARLRRRFREQTRVAQEPAWEKDPFRRARKPGHRATFESLLDAPLSQAILHPTPMPVEVAPLDELEPIFKHMEEGAEAAEDCMEFTRGAHYQDGRIDMCKQVVADRHIGALVDSIRHNENVRHFLLGNNIVGDGGASHISRLLHDRAAAATLQTLYLAGNCLGAEGMVHLAQALRGNRTVKSFWLKRNPLHADGARHLARLLEENQTLQTLDLVNTGLLDDGVEALFAGLRHNTTLRTLYLDANGVTPAGAQHIADYFMFLKQEGRKGLTGLFLGINRLGDEGAVILAEALRGYEHLVRLELSSNRMQVAGLKAVLSAAETLPALRHLGLGFYKSTTDLGELPNYFDGEGADVIADFLRSNRSLQVLDLNDVNLREDGVDVILDALEENPTLLYLYPYQYGQSFHAQRSERLERCLTRNVQAVLGMDLKTFRGDPLRFIKHTEDVRHIDSIYRNRMQAPSQ